MRPTTLVAALAACCASAAVQPSATCASLEIDATKPINVVAPYYATWNIDSSRNRNFFDINFSDPQLGYLAGQVGGSRIRFGGSGNDVLYYGVGSASPCQPTTAYECLNSTWWNNLVSLSTAASSPLVVGLNIHPNGTVSPPKGPWDPTNAKALLSYALAQGQAASIFGLELGNEQNSEMSAAQQAAALHVLAGVLDEVWGAADAAVPRPALLGPDTHSLHDGNKKNNAPTLAYLQEYVKDTAGILSAVTHHEYIEVAASNALNATFLDASAAIAAEVVQAVRSINATIPIWAGEIGPHNGGGSSTQLPDCGGTGACGRFGSTVWYADSLGAKAAAGYAAYARQDFIGADYGLLNYTTFAPSTDYWFLAAWKAAKVGRAVLAVAKPSSSDLRAYAFCGAENGTAVLILINLDPSAATCVSPPAFAAPSSPLVQFTLTPTDGTVTSEYADLNGVTLRLQPNGTLPPLSGKSSPAGSPVTLPPASVTLLVVAVAESPITAACFSTLYSEY